ncbi:MAG TPA: DUF4235 domain-containing protein [Gemmatimonadales bacterium]|nr:DUF4235 domain-containing protein [Gemmatimonadales bacterium]
MRLADKLLWKLYAAAIGALMTVASKMLIKFAWKSITGREPPSPSDPEAPLQEAVSWTVASAIGVGVTQILTQRFAAKRWSKDMGTETPTGRTKIIVSA